MRFICDGLHVSLPHELHLESLMGGMAPRVTHGGMAPAATITFKRLVSLIAEKQQQDYIKTIPWIRCLLSFSLVRSSVMCLRGARSSYHHPMKPDFDTPWMWPSQMVTSQPIELLCMDHSYHLFSSLLFLDYSGLVSCTLKK